MDMKNLHLALEEAIRDTIAEDPAMAEYRDWHYKDLPRMTPALMETFRAIVGEENAKWLTFADYGNSVRGQLLISPQGMQNLQEWASSSTQ